MRALLIEDNHKEVIAAVETLHDSGIYDIQREADLNHAERQLGRCTWDVVLTGLCMPSGKGSNELDQKYLEIFEEHQNKTYPTGPSEADMLYVMYQAMSRKQGISEERALSYLRDPDCRMVHFPEIEMVRENLAQAVEVYDFKVAQMKAENGILPVGIDLAQQVKIEGSPITIVTSMQPADQAYKALEHLIDVPVVHRMKDDVKDWRRGLEVALQPYK